MRRNNSAQIVNSHVGPKWKFWEFARRLRADYATTGSCAIRRQVNPKHPSVEWQKRIENDHRYPEGGSTVALSGIINRYRFPKHCGVRED
jgi:hypothetical protein